MNDNTPVDPLDVPEWAWEIIEKHYLAFRSDTPLAAATVLLADAAFDLKTLSETAHREQALAPDTRRHVAACAEILADAIRLADLCPSKPARGTVSAEEDGTLTWPPEDWSPED
jgi:hypothetical protein